MVTFSQLDVIAHEERMSRTKRKAPEAAAERETGRGALHDQIIQHCNSQWPRWKFRHARTDLKTTEEMGVEDFTIFLPGGKTLHCECKSKTGKLSNEQLGWIHEMKLLGHPVHVIRSLAEFQERCRMELEASAGH